MSVALNLKMIKNSNNSRHLFAYVTDKMLSVLTKEMKDLNINLYFVENEVVCSASINA